MTGNVVVYQVTMGGRGMVCRICKVPIPKKIGRLKLCVRCEAENRRKMRDANLRRFSLFRARSKGKEKTT